MTPEQEFVLRAMAEERTDPRLPPSAVDLRVLLLEIDSLRDVIGDLMYRIECLEDPEEPRPVPTSYLRHIVEMFQDTATTNLHIPEGEDYAPNPENDAPWNVINTVTFTDSAD